LFNKVKIGSIALLTTLLVIVFALSFSINNTENENIKLIELKGNYHLSKKEYLRFAKIDNAAEYSNLTQRIIKDRLEKHPYIAQVDVLLNNNKLSIQIEEKKFESLLMFGDKEYLISENSIVIPKLLNSEKIDYPIINNPMDGSSIREFEKATKNKDVKIGLKMIEALKIINPNMYNELSEIDMRNGKDILIRLSRFDAPIVVGRKNEIEKIIYLEKLVSKIDQAKNINVLSYIDLRYSNYIYVGKLIGENSLQESDS